MNLKKTIFSVIALFMLAICATCFAGPLQATLAQKEQAIAVAKAEVPANINYLGIKNDEDEFEVSFQDPATLEYYEVEVIAATGKIKTIEIKGANTAKSATVNQTEADIKAIVLAAYPDAQNLVITQDTENGLTEYEAKFTATKFTVKLELNPATGAICKREHKYF
ncbi:MAG: PepSY domain-containing protein [Acidaminococcaceae bacterium]